MADRCAQYSVHWSLALLGVNYAMFGCTHGCRQAVIITTQQEYNNNNNDNGNNNSNKTNNNNDSRAERLSESELPPQTPPKLTRREDTRPPAETVATVASPPVLGRRAPLSSKVSVRRRAPERHFLACARGDVDELSQWLAGPAGDADARDSQGWPLILHASMHGRLECVQLLLKYGARHDACSAAGHTPLHGAAANRHCAVVRSLVEAGACVDAQNGHGNTPLHSATATGSLDVVSYLLSRSANPDAVNSLGETADKVCGAGHEAFLLLEEARRKKKARISQRLALLNLHILYSCGRAVPKSPISTSPSSSMADVALAIHNLWAPRRESLRPLDEEGTSTFEIEGTASFSGGDETDVENGQEGDGLGSAPESATIDRVVVCGEDLRRALDTEEDVGADDSDDALLCSGRSLESTLAGVAALPEEVFRRLVTFCTL